MPIAKYNYLFTVLNNLYTIFGKTSGRINSAAF
jgi:hypothetical protein